LNGVINPVAWTPVNSLLPNTLSDRLAIPEVSVFKPNQPDGDTHSCLSIFESFLPLSEEVSTIFFLIVNELEHVQIVAYKLLKVQSMA
jgi:hypothetical protein